MKRGGRVDPKYSPMMRVNADPWNPEPRCTLREGHLKKTYITALALFADRVVTRVEMTRAISSELKVTLPRASSDIHNLTERGYIIVASAPFQQGDK